jgi:tetratricopeptide (TPR) repeat protein
LAEEPDNPVMLVLRSAASTQLNRRADAIRDLDRVLLSNPDNWNALNNKGHLLRKEGDIAGALQAFDMAISVNPMVAELYLNRSDLLGEDLNQFDLAISDLDYALTELPQLTLQQRAILLQTKALALTAWDKDKDEEAEAVLSELKEIAEGWGIVDVKPLIRHIHGMRQQRLSINRSPTSTRSSKPT